MSVGFLHTPNFAAFWPKPGETKDSGTMCCYHANSSPPYPPLADVRLLSKTEKKTSRNRKILGQCAGMMQTVLHLTPPLADVRLLSKKQKNIEKSKDFVQNQKKPREIEKKNKDSGTMCWYHVNILLARLVFLDLFDFSRFLSVLDKNFRFLDVFLILDGFFRILNVFLILDTFF